MPFALKRSLVKIGGSLRLTIPPEVAQFLGVKDGDQVEFDTNDSDVVIRKAKTAKKGA